MRNGCRSGAARAPSPRPDGPLVWLHSASVGELISDPAADRAHPRARHHRAGDDRNRHLGRTCRAAPAAGRHPSVRAARHAAIRDAFPRPLAAQSRAVCRIRSVAQPDHGERQAQHSADPDQWPGVGALVQSLEARTAHHRGLAQPLRSLPCAVRRGRRALRRPRRATLCHDRQSQARCACAAGRYREAVGAQGRGRHTPDHCRHLHPSGRGSRGDRRASPAQAHLSGSA